MLKDTVKMTLDEIVDPGEMIEVDVFSSEVYHGVFSSQEKLLEALEEEHEQSGKSHKMTAYVFANIPAPAQVTDKLAMAFLETSDARHGYTNKLIFEVRSKRVVNSVAGEAARLSNLAKKSGLIPTLTVYDANVAQILFVFPQVTDYKTDALLDDVSSSLLRQATNKEITCKRVDKIMIPGTSDTVKVVGIAERVVNSFDKAVVLANSGKSGRRYFTTGGKVDFTADSTVEPSQKPSQASQELSQTMTERKSQKTLVNGHSFEKKPSSVKMSQMSKEFYRMKNVADYLPSPLRRLVLDAAQSFEVFPEMVIGGLLSTLAAALMGHVKVHIKADWEEELCLYSITCAEPSERKSPVYKAIDDPLRRALQEYDRQHRKEYERADIMLQNAIAVKKKANSQYMSEPTEENSKLLDKAIEGVLAATAEAAQNHPIYCYADNCTTEALGEKMNKHGGKAFISSDEGDVFSVISGMYSPSGKVAIGLLLKGFSGQNVSVDRVHRDSVTLDRPLISFNIYTQPSVLKECLGNTAFRGQGLLSRFLISMPESKVGHRTFNTPQFKGVKDTDYNKIIGDIVRIVNEHKNDTYCLHVSPEANDLLCGFDMLKESLVNRELRDVKDLANKISGIACRLAAIFHIVNLVYHSAEQVNMATLTGTQISGQCMYQALQVARYYLGEALYLYGSGEGSWIDQTGMTLTDELGRYLADAVRTQKKILSQEDGDTCCYFTMRDLKRHLRPSPDKIEEYQNALLELKDRGLLCMEDAGRTTRYYVNPSITTVFS